MRAYIHAIDDSTVLYRRDVFGERREDTLFAPRMGGYVRIFDDAQRFPQVCERLSRSGNTLIWHGPGPLVDLIRAEHRKAMRDPESILRF